MIYENQEAAWSVNTSQTGQDDMVRFAFECNETTSHDNEESINTTVSSV